MRKDYDHMLAKMARDGALGWMDDIIKHQERGVAELKRRREQFSEACDKSGDVLTTPVNVLSWFINDIQNVQRNIRLDLAVNHSAALSVAAQRQEA